MRSIALIDCAMRTGAGTTPTGTTKRSSDRDESSGRVSGGTDDSPVVISQQQRASICMASRGCALASDRFGQQQDERTSRSTVHAYAAHAERNPINTTSGSTVIVRTVRCNRRVTDGLYTTCVVAPLGCNRPSAVGFPATSSVMQQRSAITSRALVSRARSLRLTARGTVSAASGGTPLVAASAA